jgi:hypothetical protein
MSDEKETSKTYDAGFFGESVGPAKEVTETETNTDGSKTSKTYDAGFFEEPVGTPKEVTETEPESNNEKDEGE